MLVASQMEGGWGNECQDLALWLAVAVLDTLEAECWLSVGPLASPVLAKDEGDHGGAEVVAAVFDQSADYIPEVGGATPSTDCVGVSCRSCSKDCRDRNVDNGGVHLNKSM